jgi:hypothetical protein
MKNNLVNSLTAVLAASTMVAGSARADELPQTKAHQKFSVTQGFRVVSLAALQRGSALGQSEVSAALIEKLRPASVHESANIKGRLRSTGDQWSLEVSSDGTAAEYRDLEVEARAHSLGRQVTNQMSASEMEQRGRAFIESNLASQIVLGANEELVALRADYRTEGGQDLNTGQITRAVVANRIVFGRVRDGVPVVGNGSKVILTFINDGSLESFHYDWPTYQTGGSQNIAEVGEVLSRMQKVMVARTSAAAPASRVAVPVGGGREYPLALTSSTQLQVMECGYYDPGASGKIQSVQAGCTYLAVSQDASGMRQGYAGAVPAAASFTPDEGWLETKILGRK